jgi:hypothetical protein
MKLVARPPRYITENFSPVCSLITVVRTKTSTVCFQLPFLIKYSLQAKIWEMLPNLIAGIQTNRNNQAYGRIKVQRPGLGGKRGSSAALDPTKDTWCWVYGKTREDSIN